MSWLTYGLDPDNSLISIDHVPRGRSTLRCPYCVGALIAKKGAQKAHHFAHALETCRAITDREETDLPLLPLYDRFNLHLSNSDFVELQQLWNRYGINGRGIPSLNSRALIDKGLIAWNPYRGHGSYEFTKLGKIPVAALSLRLFNEIQEEFISQRLNLFESLAFQAFQPAPSYCHLKTIEALTDLRLYRAQLKRILSLHLYYLEIQAEGQTFYKIGVTHRAVEQRVQEIESDLRSHFSTLSIKTLGIWEHRGNVELYFKYCYQSFNTQIGSLTEYFQFDPEDAKAALRDLKRMKPKVLTPVEQDLLADIPTAIEQAITAEQQAYQAYERQAQRAQAIRTGMKRAEQWGHRIGRPKGKESDKTFLSKPANQPIITAMQEGLSLRQIADKTGSAINTIRKVKALLEDDRHD
jgi:hypothetical protein